MKKNSHDLTKTNVEHLATLSKLELTDEENVKILNQLNETLAYVENLHELNTDAVASENTHVTNNTNRFSDDVIDETQMLTQDEALKNAPVKKKHYFVVRRIL